MPVSSDQAMSGSISHYGRIQPKARKRVSWVSQSPWLDTLAFLGGFLLLFLGLHLLSPITSSSWQELRTN